MKIDGGCFCGAVVYEADVDPENTLICHCTDCQSLSGSAFRSLVITAPGSFRLLKGALTTFVKTADSGNKRLLTFCPVCGSSIYSTTEGADPKTHSLRLGTVKQRAELTPKKQYWHRSAAAWLDELPLIPRTEKN